MPRKSVDRSTNRPDMTLDVYRGRKTTPQSQPTGKEWENVFTTLQYRVFKFVFKFNFPIVLGEPQ